MIRRIAMSAMALVMVAGPAIAAEEGWSGDVSASLSAQTGTTSTLSANVDAKTARTWENDVASLRLTGTYGTSETRGNEETTQDTQALFGDWKHTVSERFFWDTGSELSRDSRQDRKIRVRIDSGPGFRAWQGEDAAKSHFDLSAGVGYRYEVYDGNSNTAFASTDIDQFVDAVAGFEYKNLLFDDKIEWTHTGSVSLPMNSVEAYILRSEIILGVPLTEAWSFRTGFLVEYTNTVPDGVNRTTTNTTLGLGYKF